MTVIIRERFNISSEFYRVGRDMPLVLYKPDKENANSKIGILAMHPDADYLSFAPCIELAKRGFIAAGANAGRGGLSDKLRSVKQAVEFMRQYTGIKALILLGHSGGGSLLSCYQYIAENGTERFKNTDRIIPFDDVDRLVPADGMLLLDNNYGIMDVLCVDPAVKSRNNGFERLPELDIFLPENGYSPDGAHYSDDFKRKFQKAQIKVYEDLLCEAQEKLKDIKAGRGSYIDNDSFVVPGASNMSNGNKLFLQDVSLLNHTRNKFPLLRKGGAITNEIIHTVRLPGRSIQSEKYRWAFKTTVVDFLKAEVKFEDDFGYDSCSMWGSDWNFNPNSTRANVKGISVPMLIEGNTGSHEFMESEYIYENAGSTDKDIVFLEGADHNFMPVKRGEDAPDKYGNTLETLSDYITEWLAKPGRFIN